jgi:hypothetical protein
VGNEGGTESKTILGSEAAHCEVQGMIGEQKLGATADFAKAEARATVDEAIAFAAEVGAELSFLCAGQIRKDEAKK